MSEENKTDKTAFWSYLGGGLFWFFLALGIGTCSMLEKSEFHINNIEKHDNPQNKP